MDPQPFAFGALLAATFVTAALPGPCAVMAAGRSARGGSRSGLLVSCGVMVGHTVLLGAAFGLILGALALPDAVFHGMKWAGVVVLIGLAAGMLRAPARGARETPRVHAGDLVAGLMVSLPSPHAFVFVLALMPQFVQPGRSIAPAILAAAVFLSGVAATQLVATAFGASLRRLAEHRRWIDYAGAATLFSFAAAAVLTPTG